MAVTARPKILFVDDEPDLLSALMRTLRPEGFDMTTASSGVAALELLGKGASFAVIVSDLRMPVMDGVTLLQRARECAPNTIRVLFTGQPDMDKAIEAINKGAIFRFITKPASRISLAMTLNAAVEQHRLVTAERVLLEETLRGSIKALTDILSLVAPMAFGRATRLQQTIHSLIAASHTKDSWYIEVAAMLSQVGCVILPPATLERVYQGEVLSEAEQAMTERMPAVVEQVLGNIPRLEPVKEVLRFQNKKFDGTGLPAGAPVGTAIPWGARALKVATDLDTLENEGISPALALDTMRGRAGWYDPDILQLLSEIRKSTQKVQVRELPLMKLQPGMVLAQDVRTTQGALFIARGQEVTQSLLEKLQNFAHSLQRTEAIRVILYLDNAG